MKTFHNPMTNMYANCQLNHVVGSLLNLICLSLHILLYIKGEERWGEGEELTGV
jgi:hypothetical protein